MGKRLGMEHEYRAMLMRLVDETPEFNDPDEEVSGADLVEWFGEIRADIIALLKRGERS